MKKAKVWGCILFCTMGSSAYAQSSVTLYGLVEAGVGYTNNVKGSSEVALNSGHENQSRFGFLGKEDLGNGTRAIFQLENGFDTTTGALGSGLLFSRQAYVGLANDQYGTVTLGRQYDTPSDNLSLYGAWVYGGYYSNPMGNFDHTAGDRTNNSIKYVTPSFAGLTLEAMYGFGGEPGSITEGSTIGFGASYVGGNLSLGAAALLQRNTPADLNASFGIKTFDGIPLAAGLNGSSSTTPVQTGSYNIYGVGGSYVFGQATFAGILSLSSLRNAYVPARDFGNINVKTAQASVNYQYTPSLAQLVDASYVTFDGFKWATFGTAFNYQLSKRMDLFAVVAYNHAMGNAQFADIYTTTAPSSTSNQVVFRVGMKQAF